MMRGTMSSRISANGGGAPASAPSSLRPMTAFSRLSGSLALTPNSSATSRSGGSDDLTGDRGQHYRLLVASRYTGAHTAGASLEKRSSPTGILQISDLLIFRPDQRQRPSRSTNM